MARWSAGIFRQQAGLLLAILVALLPSVHALGLSELLPRNSDPCPSSYNTCGGNLPSDFCCPSSSTCISLDGGTSAICCPAESNCDYISPITCDIEEQNVNIHSKSSIKTTRLGDTLSTCGGACCPFGYTCSANSTCALDKKTSNTAATSATTTGPSQPTTAATITPLPSPSMSPSQKTTDALTPIKSCPSFPSKAVVAGFFPGTIFGAVLALLLTICIRRRTHKNQNQPPYDPKTGRTRSPQSSTGAIMGISRPIASEDYSTRTDFLLRPAAAKHTSMSARSTKSMLHRTGDKVRSLFSTVSRFPGDDDIPPIPTTYPVTPQRQREPSTESIKVFTPPGAFAQSRKFLGPEPYPGSIARPDTTFTDLMQVVGFNDSKGNLQCQVRVEDKC